jgi:hypothetical protein
LKKGGGYTEIRCKERRRIQRGSLWKKEDDTERFSVKKGGGYMHRGSLWRKEVDTERFSVKKEEDTERFSVKKGGGYREVLCEERRRIQRGSL